MDKTSNNIKVNTIIMYSIVLTPFLDHSKRNNQRKARELTAYRIMQPSQGIDLRLCGWYYT